MERTPAARQADLGSGGSRAAKCDVGLLPKRTDSLHAPPPYDLRTQRGGRLTVPVMVEGRASERRVQSCCPGQ